MNNPVYSTFSFHVLLHRCDSTIENLISTTQNFFNYLHKNNHSLHRKLIERIYSECKPASVEDFGFAEESGDAIKLKCITKAVDKVLDNENNAAVSKFWLPRKDFIVAGANLLNVCDEP